MSLARVTGWTAEFWRGGVLLGTTDKVRSVEIDGLTTTITFVAVHFPGMEGPAQARTMTPVGPGPWTEVWLDEDKGGAVLVQRLEADLVPG